MESDPFAKGMAITGDDHFDLTPELDRSQYKIVRPHLGAGKSLLEIGAGYGRISQLLIQDNISPRQYVISEPSEYFFEQLKRRITPLGNAILAQGGTSDLVGKYPQTFDTVFSVHTLEHVENDGQFLADCFQMLKIGGKLVTLVPALQFLYSNLDRNIGHYRRYDKKMVRKLVQGSGFEIEKIYYSGFLAVFASLYFLKIRKLDYQKNESNKKQFLLLQHLYSKYFIPINDWIERFLPIPMGINLTFILRKTDK